MCGRGPHLPTRGRGRAERPPRGDVRLSSPRVTLETAFPSLRVSGGCPLPFIVFFNGGRGRCRADPAPSDPGSPCPLCVSVYLFVTPRRLQLPGSLGCHPSGRYSPREAPRLGVRCVPAQGERASGRQPLPGWCPRTPGLDARQRPEGWAPWRQGKCPRPALCRRRPCDSACAACRHFPPHPPPSPGRSPGSQPSALTSSPAAWAEGPI